MSVEGVTDGVARVVALAPGIKAAYSSASSGQPDVQQIPQDIADTPVAVVRHERFDSVSQGTPEILVHLVSVDVYVSAANAGEAERRLLPLVTSIIATFRTHVGLFANAFTAQVANGGPADDVLISGKPYIVYPITVRAREFSTETYTL